MPERLALIGDIHANLPALRAVLDAVAASGITDGACTGDLVMRGEDPEGCVAALRELDWPCVMGNTDHKVATRPPRDPGHPRAKRVGSRTWSTNQLSPESLAFLAGLPMVRHLTLRGLRIAVVHGEPDDPREAIDAHTPERDVARLIDKLKGPHCIVSGHTHRPLVRDVRGCLLVNPGSVGEAVEGDRRPRWAWLEARRTGLRAYLEHVPADLATIRTP